MPTKGKLQDSTDSLLGVAEPASAKASATTTTINLITGGLGAGILSLPWATAGASVLSAAVLNAVVLSLNVWTIMLLIHAGERHQRFDLGALLEMLPGKLGVIAKPACNFCIWLTMFLCLVGYFIVVEDSATYVVPDTVQPAFLDYRPPWGGAIAVLLVPLCFLDMKYLSFTSWVSVFINIYIFAYTVYLLFQNQWKPHDSPCWVGMTSGTFTFFAALMFSVIIQMCVLPMYQQLEDRTPAKFRNCVVIAFSFLFVFTTLFSGASYMLYGSKTESNILLNFPRDVPADIARIGMLLVILGVYPLMLYPMVAPIRTWEEEKAARQPFHALPDDEEGPIRVHTLPSSESGESIMSLTSGVKPSRWWSTFLTLVIIGLSAGVSFFISDLGLMNVINGAISVTMFVAFCPTLVGLYLGDTPSWRRKGALYCLFVFGLTMSALGFVFTDNNADSLVQDCVVPME